MAMAREIPEMENLVACPICMETFDRPKMLSCQHSYCLECIFETYQKSYLRGEGQCVICPECRSRHKLNGINQLTIEEVDSQLPNNFLLLSVLDVKHKVYSHMDELSKRISTALFVTERKSEERYSCLCGNDAIWLCSNCNVSLCTLCLVEHNAAHQSHEVESIYEDKRSLSDNITTNSTDCICGGKTIWHCKTCDIPLCNNCFPDHLDAFDKHELFEVSSIVTTDAIDELDEARNYVLDLKKELDGMVVSKDNSITWDIMSISKVDGSVIIDTKTLLCGGGSSNASVDELQSLCSYVSDYNSNSFESNIIISFEKTQFTLTKEITLTKNGDNFFLGISERIGLLIFDRESIEDDSSNSGQFIIFIFRLPPDNVCNINDIYSAILQEAETL